MALYSIGASWNPGMSEPNRTVERALRHEPARAFHPPTDVAGQYVKTPGLAGISGLSFSYRLQQWGPRTGPTMLPANAYPSAYIPSGLGNVDGPFTWFMDKLGISSPDDILKETQAILSDTSETLSPASTKIQTLIGRARAFDHSTDTSVQAKAQACMSQGAGLVSALTTLQGQLSSIKTQVANATYDKNTSKDTALDWKETAEHFSDQVDSFTDTVDALESSVKALEKYAQVGASGLDAVTGQISKSISTLTWIAGVGGAVYLLAPSFIPRLIRGVRS